jgi:putative nucleotidyltransferase with HDIG domain
MTIALPQRLRVSLEELQALPTLPAVALRVMELARAPETPLDTLAKLIERDPALSAAILRVVNSAFYERPQPVSSVQRALVVLGVAEVRRICLVVAVFKAFPERPGQAGLDRKLFWQHSAACGVAARRLCELLKSPHDGEEFTAGLLHDVGKLILDLCFPESYREAVAISYRDGCSMAHAERQLFDADHTEVGAWLAERWKLPGELTAAIRWHDSPELAPEPHLAAIVHLADVFARVTGNGFGGERGPVAVQETAAWNILWSGAGREPLDVEWLTFRLEDEMAKHRDLFAGATP